MIPEEVVLKDSPQGRYLSDCFNTANVPLTSVSTAGLLPSPLPAEFHNENGESPSAVTMTVAQRFLYYGVIERIFSSNLSNTKNNIYEGRNFLARWVDKLPQPNISIQGSSIHESSPFDPNCSQTETCNYNFCKIFDSTTTLTTAMLRFYKSVRSIRIKIRNCELFARGYRLSAQLPPKSTIHRLEYSQHFLPNVNSQDSNISTDTKLRQNLQCGILRCYLLQELEKCSNLLLDISEFMSSKDNKCTTQSSSKDNICTTQSLKLLIMQSFDSTSETSHGFVPFLEELQNSERCFRRQCENFFMTILQNIKFYDKKIVEESNFSSLYLILTSLTDVFEKSEKCVESLLKSDSSCRKLCVDTDVTAIETRSIVSAEASVAAAGIVHVAAELRMQLEASAAALLILQQHARNLKSNTHWPSNDDTDKIPGINNINNVHCSWIDIKSSLNEIKSRIDNINNDMKPLLNVADKYIQTLCDEERKAQSSPVPLIHPMKKNKTKSNFNSTKDIQISVRDSCSNRDNYGDEIIKDDEKQDIKNKKDKREKIIEVFEVYTGASTNCKLPNESKWNKHTTLLKLKDPVFAELTNTLTQLPSLEERNTRIVGDTDSSDEDISYSPTIFSKHSLLKELNCVLKRDQTE